MRKIEALPRERTDFSKRGIGTVGNGPFLSLQRLTKNRLSFLLIYSSALKSSEQINARACRLIRLHQATVANDSCENCGPCGVRNRYSKRKLVRQP